MVAFRCAADPVNPFDGGGRPYWGYGARTALASWAKPDHHRASLPAAR
ncbi:hypothetical protein GCM10009647_063410 [Streptomyces sanglieri]|uniref:Uncharacterized protein n=1 Tax=Streptomyces sanglieri TaxID=193460 RepID=A0ABW2WM31_9ACTN